jgi:MYXO-CTERM domain-containing protein
MKHAVVSSFASLVLGATAVADLTGFTATRRQVSGGFLINVYATTNASTDVILNVSGGSVGLPTAGYIRTNSPGGFRRGTGSQSVFAPSGSQNWTTLDSFLTVGGGFNTTTNAWLGNGATQGDPPWNVTYTDTDTGEATTVSSFNTQDNASGFTNPNVNSIPATAGWFIAGSTSPARSLASLGAARNGYTLANGINYGASSAAAAAAANGFLVAQLYVSELSVEKFIDWKMSATLRRVDGSTSNASFQMRVGDIPAPGALALLGLAGVASRRRRA